MTHEATLFGKPLSHWLSEHRRMEQAVATRISVEGERFQIGNDWVDILPIGTDDGHTEVHIIAASDPDLTLPAIYHHLFGDDDLDNGAMLTTDTLSLLHQRMDDLSREVAELKRSPRPKPPKSSISSPYLSATDAAAYLAVSIDSLYGLVERRLLVPLRGPKRSYRFTTAMLDDYLRRGNGKK